MNIILKAIDTFLRLLPSSGVQKPETIHFLHPLNPSKSNLTGLEPIAVVTGQEEGYQSITGPHRDKQPSTLTLTPKVNLESPLNLTCMFFQAVVS